MFLHKPENKTELKKKKKKQKNKRKNKTKQKTIENIKKLKENSYRSINFSCHVDNRIDAI